MCFLISLYYNILICWISGLFLSKSRQKKPYSILFLEVFPTENAGYQYRAAKWAQALNKKGFTCEVKTLCEDANKFEEQQSTNYSQFLRRCMRIRFRQCIYARRFETVIVRRELLLFNDYGNLFMEKFLLKIHPNVILDFDDDIAAAKKQPKKVTSLFGKLALENGDKFNQTLQLYRRFIVGTDYLKSRVLKENPYISDGQICVIPTCVDYDQEPAKKYTTSDNNNKIVFGWIGGNHNLKLLDIVVDPLNQIAKKHQIKLVVVAGRDYSNPKASFTIENRRWSLASEKKIIKRFDIGLMPVRNNLEDRGKCGFKLIQYMGVGVVSIATNVTINGEIVEDGVNGYLVKPDNSNWLEVLEKAIYRRKQWREIGKKARQTIVTKYTFIANENMYQQFIRKCAE